MQKLENLKYPIGKYNPPQIITSQQIKLWINSLANLPQEVSAISAKLSKADLETPYRPDGWTARQVIHHLADSHLNAYIRFRLTLTEEKPIVRPYFEERWAELADAKTGDIAPSLDILKAVHQRLVALCLVLTPSQFDRTYIHPDVKNELTLAYLLGLYAWHGQHHLAHLKAVIK